jgi:hypothetical protein
MQPRRANQRRAIFSADWIRVNSQKPRRLSALFADYKFVVEPPVRIPSAPAGSPFEPIVLRTFPLLHEEPVNLSFSCLAKLGVDLRDVPGGGS